MEYIFTDLPQYVKVNARTDFDNAIVKDGCVLLFSEDGSTLTAKTADGSFVSVGTGGGTGGVDTSKDTVNASVLLEGYTAHDRYGHAVVGNIKTVTLTRNGNTVNVKAGYIATDDSITIESSGADVSGVTANAQTTLVGYIGIGSDGSAYEGIIPINNAEAVALFDNIVVVPPGYYGDIVELEIDIADDAIVNGNIVTIQPGLITEQRTVTIAEAKKPTVNGNTVTVFPGYNKDQQTITVESTGGGVDVSGVTATADDVLEGCQFVTKDGELMEGKIPIYQISDIIPTANTVFIESGYYAGTGREITIGTAVAPGTITPGTTDVVLSQGSFLIDDVRIKGEPNWKEENIAEGVSMWGKVGTFKGGSGGGGATTEYYYCATRNEAAKTWQGYKYVAGTDGKYTMATTTSSLTYGTGLVPQIGGIYDAAAAIRVFSVTPTDQKCVCLCRFDYIYQKVSAGSITKDETGTCVVEIGNQSEIRYQYSKFGGSAGYHNYYGEDYGGAGFYIYGLPLMDAFTIEWWQFDYEQSRGEGNYAIHQSATSDYPAADITSVTITKDDSRFLYRTWFHRAFVREAGSTTVTEYRNGVAIGTCTFTPPLGTRDIGFYTGCQEFGGNAYHYSDDFAIHNYAKYHGNFTPPEVQMPDVPANIGGTPPVREVTVAGSPIATALNRADYALVDPSATGTERVWASSDNRFFIRFDEMDYGCWILSDFPVTAWVEEDDSMIGAVLARGPEGWIWDEDTGEEYEGEPIGGEWQDMNGNVMTVTYNQ